MYINATGFYVPEARVDNQHFLELNGLTSEWIEQRTGIRTRAIAKPEENINTMSMEAIRNALPLLPYDITEVDLIISASYSPYDTVATAAHKAQFEFNIKNAKALYLSSACSSFLNALEVVEGYFAMGKASKALILEPIRTQLIGMRPIRKPDIYGEMQQQLSSFPKNESLKKILKSLKYIHKGSVICRKLLKPFICALVTVVL